MPLQEAFNGIQDKDAAFIDALKRPWADVMAKCLNEGADPNARDVDGTTALELALEHGNAGIVRLLLDKGADVEAANPSGWTGFMREVMKSARLLEATIKNDVAGAEQLVANSAYVNAHDEFGANILWHAAKHGHT